MRLAVWRLVFLLTLAWLAVTPCLAQAQPAGFPDVSSASPYFEPIQFPVGAGIISGFNDGTFGPGQTLKRGQATKILVLWRGVPSASNGPNFSDLDVVYRSYVPVTGLRLVGAAGP